RCSATSTSSSTAEPSERTSTTAVGISSARRRPQLPQRRVEPVQQRNGAGETAPALAPPFDRFDLTGRVAIVTGGTRGLGRSIIRTLAQAGADIVVSSRKQEACDAAAKEVRSLGRRALALHCHVGHWDEIDTLVDAAYSE